VGADALARLKQAAGPEAAAKLDRAPTLVAATSTRREDPVEDLEDLCPTACAVYAVLPSAHGRGLAGYWRTPGVLRTKEGLDALSIPAEERFIALIHLGWSRQEKRPPERLEPANFVEYLS